MARRGVLAYTDDLAKEVLAGVAVGLTDEDAALSAGISQDTLARWRDGKSGAPADFAEKYARARPRRAARWLSKLWQLAEAGDTRAVESLLDRCAPEYRKTQQVEVGNKDGQPFVMELKVVSK
jgi:hypothetical protein